MPIVSEIDVLWINRGSGSLRSAFEIEHTTPIYSGLLRFNDVLLNENDTATRFNIVSNNDRRGQFVQQINRPTFRVSGLVTLCTFINYKNIFSWYARLTGHAQSRG